MQTMTLSFQWLKREAQEFFAEAAMTWWTVYITPRQRTLWM
jgi:hypothetical protein